MGLVTSIQSTGDRWYDHRAVHMKIGNDAKGERRHLWRYNTDRTEIIIRQTDQPIEVPEGKVVFTVECLPVMKIRGKRIPVSDPVEWLTKKLSPAIDVAHIICRPISGTIQKGNASHNGKFSRPAWSFIGYGDVRDRTQLEEFLLNGVGDAKTYGFGMLEVESI